MPRNKREGIFFGVVMALIMSLFMNLFNTFWHAGVSIDALLHALVLWPVIFAIVMVVESYAVSPLARKAAKRFADERDSVAARKLAQTICMVTGMSLVMSVIGLLLAGTALFELPARFTAAWPVIFVQRFGGSYWWLVQRRAVL